MRRTYVTYSIPGAFFAEHETREVGSRDEIAAAQAAPECAFAFHFYDVIETEDQYGGEIVMLRSKPRDHSPTYYIGGSVMDAEAVREFVDDSQTLLGNMERNGYSHVIRCRTGNFQPFNLKTDVLVQP